MGNPNQRPLNRPFMDDNLYPALATCVQGKFRGHRPYNDNKGRFAALGCTVISENGWHRARVTRGARAVYTSKPMRDRDAAMAIAYKVMGGMRETPDE